MDMHFETGKESGFIKLNGYSLFYESFFYGERSFIQITMRVPKSALWALLEKKKINLASLWKYLPLKHKNVIVFIRSHFCLQQEQELCIIHLLSVSTQ